MLFYTALNSICEIYTQRIILLLLFDEKNWKISNREMANFMFPAVKLHFRSLADQNYEFHVLQAQQCQEQATC